MAILTAADKAQYFPGVGLEDAALTAAIAKAQAIAQSPQGANRNLEIERHNQLSYVPQNAIVQVNRLPILSTPSAPVVAIRNQASYLTASQFQVLDSDEYELDTVLGELRLKTLTSHAYSAFGLGAYDRRGRTRPQTAAIKTECKITYYTGYDFNSTTDLDVQTIKIAVAGILEIFGSKGYQQASQGIQTFELTDWYKVGYGTGAQSAVVSGGAKSPIDEWLLILRQYRPREFS